MAERVYGVMHGSRTEIAGITTSDILIAPSRELMRDLLTLPPGTSVGIEDCPELQQPYEMRGRIIDFTESTKFYWGRIRRLCKRRGLNVVYLEDFETYKKYLEKHLEAISLIDVLEREMKEGGFPERVMQRMHRAQVEAEYIFVFEREKAIFDQIQATQPAIVILGRGHTDALLLNLDPFNQRGVSIGEYRAEEVFIPPWH